MPAANGPVTREILHASGKVDGKPVRWIVGAFANTAALQSFAAMLKLSYQTGLTDHVKAMDVHAPALKDGQILTDVKFSRQTIQYNPTAPGLDEDAALA